MSLMSRNTKPCRARTRSILRSEPGKPASTRIQPSSPTIRWALTMPRGRMGIRVSSPDRARDAIDCVAPTVGAPGGVVEHAIFGEDLVDSRAPAHGVVFTEDVVKI